jgi:hypothetical protein
MLWLLGLNNHICRSKLPFLLDGTLLPATAVAGRRQPRRWCQAVASTNSRCARTKEAQGAKATGCHQTWLTVKSPINGGLYTVHGNIYKWRIFNCHVDYQRVGMVQNGYGFGRWTSINESYFSVGSAGFWPIPKLSTPKIAGWGWCSTNK